MTSERRSAARQILTGGASLLLAQGSVLALTFLAQRVILSTLSKEQNGELFTQRRFIDLFVVIAVDFGMNNIVLRKAIQEPERASVILSSAAALRMVLWIVASAVALVASTAYGLSLADGLVWTTYLLITARTGLLRYSFELGRRAKMQFTLPAAAMIADAVIFLVAIWLQRHAITPTTVIVTYCLSSIPGFLLVLATDRGRTVRPQWVSAPEMRRLLVEALPMFVAFALMNIHDKADAVLLDWFSTQREVGIFGAAYVSLAPLTGTVPLAAAMVVVPVVARFAVSDWESARTFAVTGLRLLTASAILLCAILSPLTPFLIELISKGRYADNHLQYFVFMWMSVGIFPLVFLQEVFVALGRQKVNVPITAALAAVTIGAGVVLIPLGASMGAVYAKLAAVVAGAALAVYYLGVILKQGLDLRFVLSTMGVAGISAAAALYLPSLMSIWMAALVSGSIAVGAMIATGLVRPAEVRRILRTARQRPEDPEVHV